MSEERQLRRFVKFTPEPFLKNQFKSKMKKIIFLIILSTSFYGSAQMSIGTPQLLGFGGKEVSPEILDSFLKTETVFFYTPDEEREIEQYKKLLQDQWDLTPLLFVPVAEAEAYYKNPTQYSYFSRRSQAILTDLNCKIIVDGFMLRLVLHHSINGEDHPLASIFLSPSSMDLKLVNEEIIPNLRMDKWCIGLNEDSQNNLDKAYHYLMFESSFTNFNPYYLKLYLNQISLELKKNTGFGIKSEVFNKSLMASLATRKLLIPQEIFEITDPDLGAFPGAITQLLEDYDYAYEVVSNKDIEKLLLKGPSSEEHFLLIPAIMNLNMRYLGIYSPEGELIFQQIQPGIKKYLVQKDFKKLSKEVKKAS